MSEGSQTAKKLFLAEHPGQEDWFDLVWSVFAGQPAKASVADTGRFLAGLGVAGKSRDPQFEELMRTAAMVCATFLANPVVLQETVKLLRSNGRKYGVDEAKIRRMTRLMTADHTVSTGETGNNFCIWLPRANGLGSISKKVRSEEMAQLWLEKLDHFQIFYYDNSVYIHGQKIALDGRIAKLLVMFLRYKDQHLPTFPLYRKAWCMPPSEDLEEADIVELYLKTAITELRGRMKEAKGFSIPKKTRGYGYRCEGKFTYCVIVSEQCEPEYNLHMDAPLV